MRIVSGKWRGRKISVPEGDVIRPTGDRVREAWMSIVHPLLPDARVADLCAGSGALGLEALSRGAASCDFVEQSRVAYAALQANITLLGAENESVIHRSEAVRFAAALDAGAYDIAFADPPYNSTTSTELAEQ